MEETLVRQGEMLQTQAILQAQLQGMLQSQGVMIQRLNEKMEAQSTVIVQQGKDMSDMLQLFNASKMGIKAVVVVGSFASAVLAIIGAIAFFNH